MNYGLKIYCDGGARGNPGPAASAFVVERNGRTIEKNSEFLGEKTNNVAEYKGVVMALTWLTKNQTEFLNDQVIFVLDSELVAKQLSGIFKIKNENLRNLFYEVKKLEKRITKKILYKNVSREENKLADFLVNKELDENS